MKRVDPSYWILKPNWLNILHDTFIGYSGSIVGRALIYAIVGVMKVEGGMGTVFTTTLFLRNS
jgi:hypothetical protein